eukprot:1131923_1
MSPSPTPPPITSSSIGASPENGTIYTPTNATTPHGHTPTNATKPHGHTQHIVGAPTQESRLLENFLVISYRKSLKIRHRYAMNDLYFKFIKAVHDELAYYV